MDDDSKALVGRDDEIQILQEAYDRVFEHAVKCDPELMVDITTVHDHQQGFHQELVLIRGQSGTGKTVLANSLQLHHQEMQQQSKPAVAGGVFFLSGKFELATTKDPYAVFVTILTKFTNLLLLLLKDKDDDESLLLQVKQMIQTSVGSEGKLLTNMIPAIEKIIGKQDEACSEVKGVTAVHRFRLLFCKLVVEISKLVPLVLFFDDLQWSDEASVQLLEALIQYRSSTSYCDSQQQQQPSRLLLIGAYRDAGIEKDESENSATNEEVLPFVKCLDIFNECSISQKLKLTKIHLTNLNEEQTRRLVSKCLDSGTESFTKLSDILFSRCKGNPFHTLQVLSALKSQGCKLHDEDFDPDDSALVAVCGIAAATTDELVRRKLNSLPPLSRHVLQIAACMGDEINDSAISAVLNINVSDVDLSIRAARAEGHLRFDEEAGCFRFSHDRIRQAALSTIVNREATSYDIGYKLWTRAYTSKIFMVANLLNYGIHIMTNQTERYQAAALNLEAGLTAASLAAFPDACRYLKAGIAFLVGGNYWTEQYDLTLSLYNAAADAEVCVQNFDRASALIGEILQHGRTLHDQIPAHVAKINCLGQRGLLPEAIQVGIDVLRQLGENLPQVATKRAVIRELLYVKYSCFGRSDQDLLMMRPMENKDTLAATHVLMVLIQYAFHGTNFHTPLMGARLVRLCLKFGMHKNCALGFVNIGWVLCGRDRKEGYRHGQLALSIIDRARARELIPRVHVFFYGLIHHWRCRLRDSLEPLQNAIQIGLKIGDVDFAMSAHHFLCNNSLRSGIPLCDVEKMTVVAIQQMRLYQQENVLQVALPYLQLIHNLMGQAPDPRLLCGEAVKFSYASETGTATQLTAFRCSCSAAAEVAFPFGDYELAHQICEKQRSFKSRMFASFGFTAIRQIEALVAIARARQGLDKRKGIKIARQVLRQTKAWATDCPENFLCKRWLLEAELQALKPRKAGTGPCQALYDKAIASAQMEGFTHEAALANELAGNHLNRQGNGTLAMQYCGEAHELYVKWGATAKAAQLQTLASMLQPPTERT